MTEKIMLSCILFLLFSANIIHAQKGFLNIACGSTSNFTDRRGLYWIPDTKYIKVGQTHRVSQNLSDFFDYFRNLRKFPKPLNKSCYEIPVSSAQRHLLRLSFINRNVSKNHTNWPGQFKYSVETTDMLYESVRLNGSSYEYEQVLMTNARIVNVCLNRINEADPFISAIQVIELKHGMYQWARPGRILVLVPFRRIDLRGDLNRAIRYPKDDFDRIWYPANYRDKPIINTTSKISADSAADYPPSAVMQTAQLFSTGNSKLFVDACDATVETLILLYFSEIRNSTKSVSFSVSDSDEGTVFVNNITLLRNYTATEFAVQTALREEYAISFKALDGKSAIPLNAFEYYSIVNTSQRTASEDVFQNVAVEVLNELENSQRPNSLNVSWIADPCFVSPWQYIRCSRTPEMRVSHMYLSGKHLSGSMPKSLGNLTGLVYLDLSNNLLEGPLPDLSNLSMLETIDVSNNKLNGSLPGWLVKLTRHKLKKIYAENNNFSGEIPIALDKLDSANFSGNPYLHRHYSKKKSHAEIIGATIGGVLVLFILTTILIVFLHDKKMAVKAMNKKPSSSVKIPQSSNSRSFTMEEMKSATQNFSRKIGRGGFGCVYYGQLPEGVEIAVKVLSLSSRQGTDEFLNEVVILSRLNHRSLVKLLGYCNDSEELMLVYQYMPRGSLKDHLSGNIETSLTSSTSVPLDLPWKSRLKIALDAARGLEYLHSECNPRIVHRDLKSANILLDNKLNGKLSDLGLSRAIMDDDATHVTTTVKGTAGYLDPEYFKRHVLTEKSDVYSFGVVLLELVSGRAPIEQKLGEDQINLIKWVTPYVEKEDPEELQTIVDWRLKDRLRSIRSIGIVSRLAMRCVTLQQSARPDARELVQVLEEAMTTEDEAVPEADSVHSSAPRGGDSATSSSYSHNVDSAGSSHNHSDKLRSDETTA